MFNKCKRHSDIGRLGAQSHKNLAYAFLKPEHAKIDNMAVLDLCGEYIDTKVIARGPYDPENTRMRS